MRNGCKMLWCASLISYAGVGLLRHASATRKIVISQQTFGSVEQFTHRSAELEGCTFELLTAKGAMSPIQAERCNSARSL